MDIIILFIVFQRDILTLTKLGAWNTQKRSYKAHFTRNRRSAL